MQPLVHRPSPELYITVLVRGNAEESVYKPKHSVCGGLFGNIESVGGRTSAKPVSLMANEGVGIPLGTLDGVR